MNSEDCGCSKGRRCLKHIETDGLTRPAMMLTLRVRLPHLTNIIRRATLASLAKGRHR